MAEKLTTLSPFPSSRNIQIFKKWFAMSESNIKDSGRIQQWGNEIGNNKTVCRLDRSAFTNQQLTHRNPLFIFYIASSMFRITHDAHPLDAAIHSGETGMSLDRTQFLLQPLAHEQATWLKLVFPHRSKYIHPSYLHFLFTCMDLFQFCIYLFIYVCLMFLKRMFVIHK